MASPLHMGDSIGHAEPVDIFISNNGYGGSQFQQWNVDETSNQGSDQNQQDNNRSEADIFEGNAYGSKKN
jgi:hypothetical protein